MYLEVDLSRQLVLDHQYLVIIIIAIMFLSFLIPITPFAFSFPFLLFFSGKDRYFLQPS